MAAEKPPVIGAPFVKDALAAASTPRTTNLLEGGGGGAIGPLTTGALALGGGPATTSSIGFDATSRPSFSALAADETMLATASSAAAFASTPPASERVSARPRDASTMVNCQLPGRVASRTATRSVS